MNQASACMTVCGRKVPPVVPDYKVNKVLAVALLVSPDAEVRKAVASSLMHIQSPEAINLMISLLADSDFEARYYAVVGLAEATNQLDWRRNMDNFRSDESKYLKHWLDWKTPPKAQQ